MVLVINATRLYLPSLLPVRILTINTTSLFIQSLKRVLWSLIDRLTGRRPIDDPCATTFAPPYPRIVSMLAKVEREPLSASEESGRHNAAALSERQRAFARDYVLNGGNATKAAAVAGYSDSDLAKAGLRCSLNPKIQAEVRRLAVQNGTMLLPVLIRRAFEIAVNPDTPARDALTAVFGLADRLGMAPPKGGVQVNIGSNVTNNDANVLIQQVWQQRTERLSGIHAPMPDGIASPIAEPNAELGTLIEQIGGGDASPGSLPLPSDIPPHPANLHHSPETEDDDDG